MPDPGPRSFAAFARHAPGVRRGATVAALGVVVALAGCASNGDSAEHVYKLYPGPGRPDAELAIVELRPPVHAIRIDGLRMAAHDYQSATLLPGEHRIAWEATFGVSVLVNPAMHDRAEFEKTVTLAAGRRYLIRADRTTGHGYRMFLWIEDAASREVVAGTRKP